MKKARVRRKSSNRQRGRTNQRINNFLRRRSRQTGEQHVANSKPATEGGAAAQGQQSVLPVIGFSPQHIACRARQDQAAPLATMWNTNPSTVIPTATAAIGSRTSAVAFAPLTEPVKVLKSPAAQSRKLG